MVMMVRCQICEEETDSHAMFNRKHVCQMCFAKLRRGKRIYKINVENKMELGKEASKIRARVFNNGNLLNFRIHIK